MEGGLRLGFRPPVSELRESRGGGCELRAPALGSYAPPRSAVARSTRPTHGERRQQGGHPGPVDDGSWTRGGGSGTGHRKPTNAAAGRCDLTTLVPMGRGSGGRREWRKGTGGARGLQWHALHRSGLHRCRRNRRW